MGLLLGQIWQVETMLNAAEVHTMWGWRCQRHAKLDLWRSAAFRTKVLDTLHKAAVSTKDICAVVYELLAKLGGKPCLRHRHPNGIRKALAERSRRGFYARCVPVFWMPRCRRAPLPEVLEVLQV